MSTRITPWGHATVAIESGEDLVLTDPVLSQRIFWIKRQQPLPVQVGEIKQPRVLLITHAHYDHLDLPGLKYFRNDIPIVLPEGLGSLLKKFVTNPLIELAHHASHEVTPNITITAFPVSHRGFRINPFRFNTCNGYLIEMHGKRIFFSGDTAYRDFSESSGLASNERIDAALLPIACYRPEWIMKGRHMNPAEALQAFDLLKARHMIPIHWGTFQLSAEPLNEPVEWLRRLVLEKNLAERVHILSPGASWELTS